MPTAIRHPAARDRADAEGEACRAIEEHVVDDIPGPPAQSSEPRVGELVIGERSAGTREVEIRLDAIHPWSVLPVVATLYAAGESARTETANIRGPLEAGIGANIRGPLEANIGA